MGRGVFSADHFRNAMSINAKAGLTARPTSRAVTKVGVSDQVVVSEIVGPGLLI